MILDALARLGGQSVDALAAAACPRAPRRAHLPAGAAADASLEFAALPLVPGDQFALDGDDAPKLTVPRQQELAVGG